MVARAQGNIRSMTNLAAMHENDRRLDEAEKLLRRAFEVAKEKLGTEELFTTT